MKSLLAALLRAAASQLHPRMLLLTLLPFAVTALIWTGIAWFGGESAINLVQGWLLHVPGFERTVLWLFAGNVDRFATAMRVLPLLVVAVALLPPVAMTAIVAVGTTTVPLVVAHLRRGRFATLEVRGHSGPGQVLRDGLHALALTALAALLTLPLWLVPLAGWLLPLLLWGWVNARIMARDALAEHADGAERDAILRSRAWPLWVLGVATGALGVIPVAIWVGGVVAFVFWPALALVSLWLYVLVFTYSALAFAHYTLAALERQRHASAAPPPSLTTAS